MKFIAERNEYCGAVVDVATEVEVLDLGMVQSAFIECFHRPSIAQWETSFAARFDLNGDSYRYSPSSMHGLMEQVECYPATACESEK